MKMKIYLGQEVEKIILANLDVVGALVIVGRVEDDLGVGHRLDVTRWNGLGHLRLVACLERWRMR